MITSFVIQAYGTAKQEPKLFFQFERRLRKVAELDWQGHDMDQVTEITDGQYTLLDTAVREDFVGKFMVECNIPDDQLLLDLMFRNDSVFQDDSGMKLSVHRNTGQ